MHVRVRLGGQPDSIVVVDSKLTKIEQLRRLIRDKFDVDIKSQRLFYGGKLLEDGYTFHDYNIKLNDVIQLMVRTQALESTVKNETKKQSSVENVSQENANTTSYEDAESCFYTIGDFIDMRDKETGAWFEGKIVRIVADPSYEKTDKTPNTESGSDKSDSENKPPEESSSINGTSPKKSPPKKKGIAEYFSKTPKSTRKKSSNNVSKENIETDIGILYKVIVEEEPDTDYYCKLHEIRPRARKIIAIEDLKVGQKVMVNHNTDNYHEKGYWYDFKIDEIKKLRKKYNLYGTIYLGAEAIPQNDYEIKVLDHIYAIEELVPLAKRSDELKKLMATPTEKRSAPLNCLTCRDEDIPCRDCGCFKCLGKNDPEKIILCDECNNGYHMQCLTPPLTALPDEDWYCPHCKREDTVVAPGAAKQARKEDTAKGKRDWGRGMACVGKTKTCSMPANHFGPIPGIEVGMCWRFRIQLSESGVHRPPVSGIHGRDVEGAYSIVLSGGYEDDYDNGIEFTYTGSGGRDLSGNKRTAEQSCDQTLARENKALARNCAAGPVSEAGGDAGDQWRDGKPVRVVRSYKMIKHFPQYAPKEGIRYDGIYKVVKYYPEKGKSGFRVWKYLLRRDDPNPAPWEEGAKQFDIVFPDGYLEAQAEKKVKKGKGKAPTTKKRALKEESASESEDESADDEPPNKRQKKVATPEPKRGRPSRNSSVAESPKGAAKIPSMFASAAKNSPKGSKSNSKDVAEVLSTDEIEAIKADTVNGKLWDECLEEAKTKGKKEFVDHVTEVFLCIICQDVAVNPVTTVCAHNFCLNCLKLAFKSTSTQNCPACRRDLPKELTVNESLRAALRTVMPGYDAGKK